MYRCLQCGREVGTLYQGSIRCPNCGFKVFLKSREPVTKTVKAV